MYSQRTCPSACFPYIHHFQDGLFSAAYSGDAVPLSPARFLTCWWQVINNHLAGYQQQDAHEFYLFLMSHLGQSGATALGGGGSLPVSSSGGC